MPSWIKSVDDLKRGMFIAITDLKEDDDKGFGEEQSFFGGKRSRNQHLKPLVGLPLEVLEINLPFICVDTGRDRGSLDVREFQFQRLTKNYVRQFRGAPADPSYDDIINNRVTSRKTKRVRKTKRKPSPMECPQCGSHRVLKLVEPGTGNWLPYCSECGSAGDAVE